MTRHMLALVGFIAALMAVAPAGAQEIHYWGKMNSDDRQGLIQLDRQYFAVSEGDEIPGMGTVHKITDDVLIVRRSLTEVEKERLRAEGRAVFDVEQQHVGNLQRRLAPRPVRGPE